MRRATCLAAIAIMTLAVCAGARAAEGSFEWTYEARTDSLRPAEPSSPADLPFQLALDDNTREGDFGVGAGTARQFLWFNRFTLGEGQVWLDEIWVLFPPGENMVVGAPVELVVYRDPDGDPTNGAELVASFDVTIQAVDGTTFSVYPIDSPLWFLGAQDVLIGVVDRFVTSGVTSTTRPATLDTSASQGRSWVAVWSGDPPSPPTLPADSLYTTIDEFIPGNWMIRAYGRQRQDQGIPAESPSTSLILIVLMAAAGIAALRRLR